MTKDELKKEVETLRKWLNDHEYDESVNDERWNAKRKIYFQLKREWLKA